MKKKIIWITLAAVVVLVGGFCAVVAMQPSDFAITRSTVIHAPPQKVFPLVSDLKAGQAWSPWEDLDPAMQRTFAGVDGAVGSSYHWSGNNEVGEGTMTLIDLQPDKMVKYRLNFLRPMEGENEVLYVLSDQNGDTHFTWTMTGKANFAQKAVCMFMNMDEMVGSQFEKGLANLKQLAETPAETSPEAPAVAPAPAAPSTEKPS